MTSLRDFWILSAYCPKILDFQNKETIFNFILKQELRFKQPTDMDIEFRIFLYPCLQTCMSIGFVVNFFLNSCCLEINCKLYVVCTLEIVVHY